MSTAKDRMSTEQFVEKARRRARDDYDFSQVEYLGAKVKVEVICRKHGSFYSVARKILEGQGCPTCSKEKDRCSFVEFVRRAVSKFGDIFEFDASSYVSLSHPVRFRCKEHGWQARKAEDMLLKGRCGCSKCSLRRRGLEHRTSQAVVLERFRAVHGDKYDYSRVRFETYEKHVTIICRKHGEFRQLPGNHIQGNQCPRCGFRVSKRGSIWLDSLGLDLVREYRLPENRKVIVDGFDPKTRTVYLFHGSYWHGSPKVFSRNAVNAHKKVKFGVLYQRTMAVERQIRSYGYDLMVAWEEDIFRGSTDNLLSTRPPPTLRPAL